MHRFHEFIITFHRQPSIGGFSNYANYSGSIYSTLADVNLYGYPYSCQSNAIYLPTGWIIAPDDNDSISVITSYTWSTSVVLTSGNGYCTQSCSSAVVNYGSSYLQTNGYGYYYVDYCNSEILIKL
jgi:hypothetical protein